MVMGGHQPWSRVEYSSDTALVFQYFEIVLVRSFGRNRGKTHLSPPTFAFVVYGVFIWFYVCHFPDNKTLLWYIDLFLPKLT